jgi:hypothetical protein
MDLVRQLGLRPVTEASHSADVVQDAVNLEVHLIKRLLHVQQMPLPAFGSDCCGVSERTNSTNGASRTEASSQQTHRMEVLKPLAIGHVGLLPGTFSTCRVDETQL